MPAYSPERRTALVLSGTGVHGAYHAGELHALLEAGVKIDLVAGRGIGAGAAALAAVDGASQLWEPGSVWAAPRAAGLYRWIAPLRATGWVAAVLGAALAIPFAVLALGVVVYALGFLLTMTGAPLGPALITWYAGWLTAVFAGANLPTFVPRLVMGLVLVLAAVLATGLARASRRRPGRRPRGTWWRRLAPAPLDPTAVQRWFTDAITQIVRGAAPVDTAKARSVSRRYADLLAENLGQPGFRELLLIATDVDTRRDVVAALLREPYRRDMMAPRAGRERQSEVLDLCGTGRDHALEVMTAALTPPVLCEPQILTFAPDSFWRGESHRVCDRPSSIARLLEEVAAAGASQVIVVTAVAPIDSPHHLSAPRTDPRGRLGEQLAAAESAALRDALEMARLRFDAVYLICPAHNPVGPFDVVGAYDESSDRRQGLGEVTDRAYEDAYRQFVEPVVGASGEHLARTATAGYDDDRASLLYDDRAPR